MGKFLSTFSVAVVPVVVSVGNGPSFPTPNGLGGESSTIWYGVATLTACQYTLLGCFTPFGSTYAFCWFGAPVESMTISSLFAGFEAFFFAAFFVGAFFFIAILSPQVIDPPSAAYAYGSCDSSRAHTNRKRRIAPASAYYLRLLPDCSSAMSFSAGIRLAYSNEAPSASAFRRCSFAAAGSPKIAVAPASSGEMLKGRLDGAGDAGSAGQRKKRWHAHGARFREMAKAARCLGADSRPSVPLR